MNTSFINALTPLEYATKALKLLETGYDGLYVQLREEFFHKFQNKQVFSTSITSEFFENIVYHIQIRM
jgi:hypothetical protein